MPGRDQARRSNISRATILRVIVHACALHAALQRYIVWGSRMNDIVADRAKNGANQCAAPKASYDNLALHLCYGRIGISAVAAAVRYQGDAKNPAYAASIK